MRYYDPDALFYFANSVSAVACWFLIVYVVMIWMSLTVWRQHVPNPGLMTLACRLLAGFAITPVVFLLGNVVLSSISLVSGDSSLATILNFVLGALALIMLNGSIICFLLAIMPGKTGPGQVRSDSVPPKPIKEPWDD